MIMKKRENKLLETEMNKGDNAFARINATNVALSVIAFICLVMYFQIGKFLEDYRVVLLFPGLADEAEISGNKVSERYLMMAAEFVTSNYVSVSPATVDTEFSAILSLAHPTRYTDMQKKLDENARQVKELKTVTMYGDVNWSKGMALQALPASRYKSVVGAHTLTFEIGRSIFIGTGGEAPDTRRNIIELDYVVEKGRFWLLDIRLENTRASL